MSVSVAKPVNDGTKNVLVDLKNGKATLRQKSINLDKASSTLQEIVAFRKLLEDSNSVVTHVPDEHLPLIAKLAYESENLVGKLARTIRQQILIDAPESGTKKTDDAIAAAVQSVATRVNYGIDNGVGSVCIWRWEVLNMDFLPADLREKLEARRAERVQAKADLRGLYDALPLEERGKLLKGGKKDKMKDLKPHEVQKDQKLQDTKNSGIAEERTDGNKEHSAAPPAGVENSQIVQDTKAMSKDTKATSKDTDAKPKKSGKDKPFEKEATAFLSFFKKAPAKGEPLPTSVDGDALPVAGPSRLTTARDGVKAPAVTAFDATFYPFVVRKDATLAPINRFVTESYKSARKANEANRRQVVTLNDDGVEVIELDADVEMTVNSNDSNTILHTFAQSVPFAYRLAAPHLSKWKGLSSDTVKEVVEKLTDAEVEGDQAVVGTLSAALKDRRRFPVKLLQFAEDVRPAYWGTWSKRSTVVGPRTPFGEDRAVLDYEYDSEADWEPEEEGGEDVMSVDGSDEEEEVDSEVDGWLVDDDDIEAASGMSGSPPPPDDDPLLGQLRRRSLSPTASRSKKRKSPASTAGDRTSKRRKVLPLVPWFKGPCWETEIGKCEMSVLEPYRIQVFNDTPWPIDPFTWISTDLAAPSRSRATATAAAQFAVPALPPRSDAPMASVKASAAGELKKPRAPQSLLHPFPDTYLPFLLQTVDGWRGPFPALAEAVYKELKQHKVFKNSIEVKIKEVAEKKAGAWSVKDHAWASAGLIKT